MFKVIPQMKRLVAAACETYGLEIEKVAAETEGLTPRIIHPDGSAEWKHYPYYEVRLKYPNDPGWINLICVPCGSGFSMSKNNVSLIAQSVNDNYTVIPSWRGELVTPTDMYKHTYHIRKGYMLEAGPVPRLVIDISRMERKREFIGL